MRRRVMAIAGLLTATVLVGACGSSKGGTGAGATSSAAPAGGSSSGSSSAAAGRASSSQGATATEKPTSVAAVDACALLTDDDIKAAFAAGGATSELVSITKARADSPGTARCNVAWKAADDGQSNFALFVYDADTYAGIKASGTAETVAELPGGYRTFDGIFLGNEKGTVSLDGIASKVTTAAVLKAALARLP